MNIVSNTIKEHTAGNFIFCGNDILIKKEAGELLTKEDLPQFEDCQKFLDSQIVTDWFYEEGNNYNAMLLENDCVIPPRFKFIPLRHFFYLTKNEEEKKGFNTPVILNLSARAHSLLMQRITFRYCPCCSGKLTDSPNVTAKKCSICGRDFFPRIEPAVIVKVCKGDEVLLVKSKTVHSDKFSCIAGFIEQGETAEQAVAREVFEEAGIKVKNIQYKGSQAWPFPDQLMFAFTCEYEGGELKFQDEEIIEGAWFKKDALPPLPGEGSVAYNLLCKIS